MDKHDLNELETDDYISRFSNDEEDSSDEQIENDEPNVENAGTDIDTKFSSDEEDISYFESGNLTISAHILMPLPKLNKS